jgi:hypothetical protein
MSFSQQMEFNSLNTCQREICLEQRLQIKIKHVLYVLCNISGSLADFETITQKGANTHQNCWALRDLRKAVLRHKN